MVKFKAQTILAVVSNLVRPKAKATELEARHTDTTLRGSPLACQKCSRFVQIPEDVLRIIVHHLDLGDRACLLETCRYLHALMEVIQYRRLDLTNCWLSYRVDLLHQTLCERPDLISGIISYRGPLTSYSIPKRAELQPASRNLKLRSQRKQPAPSPPENVPFTKRESYRRAIFIFTKAVNIRELEFTNCTDWTSNPIWEPVRATTMKMSVTRVFLPFAAESMNIVSLLRAQPELEHLELSGFVTEFGDLKETDIPKLTSLRATLEDAANLVPGRPIVEFCHVPKIGEHALDEQLVRKLSLSTSTITKLQTRLHNPRDPYFLRERLQMWARYLPGIEHLTITVGGGVSGQVLLEEIPSLQSLRSVTFLNADLLEERQRASTARINIGGESAVQMPTVSNWDDLFLRLRERCPSLVETGHTPSRQLSSCGCIL